VREAAHGELTARDGWLAARQEADAVRNARERRIVEIRGLRKVYQRDREQLTVLDGIDLDVPEGEIYGFLGANGSGKTTTVRVLLGLVLATSGEVELLGQRMVELLEMLLRPGTLPTLVHCAAGKDRTGVALPRPAAPAGGPRRPCTPGATGSRAAPNRLNTRTSIR
jgi:energy-coupling factor transporter ATP-binding protein EcfA2